MNNQNGWGALPKREPIMTYFSYDHLPEPLQVISRPFSEIAEFVHMLPAGAERATALRKILEAKDCAVRAALTKVE